MTANVILLRNLRHRVFHDTPPHFGKRFLCQNLTMNFLKTVSRHALSCNKNAVDRSIAVLTTQRRSYYVDESPTVGKIVDRNSPDFKVRIHVVLSTYKHQSRIQDSDRRVNCVGLAVRFDN